MTSRGFIFLALVAVVASVIAGSVVERFTAPGLERTVWFGVILVAAMYPAGMFAEKRGWVRGKLDLGRTGRNADKRDGGAK
jgi:predicted transporter